MNNIKFETVYKNEQWIIDNLLNHLECSNVKVRLLNSNSELQLYCEDCGQVIVNFYDTNKMLELVENN